MTTGASPSNYESRIPTEIFQELERVQGDNDDYPNAVSFSIVEPLPTYETALEILSVLHSTPRIKELHLTVNPFMEKKARQVWIDFLACPRCPIQRLRIGIRKTCTRTTPQQPQQEQQAALLVFLQQALRENSTISWIHFEGFPKSGISAELLKAIFFQQPNKWKRIGFGQNCKFTKVDFFLQSLLLQQDLQELVLDHCYISVSHMAQLVESLQHHRHLQRLVLNVVSFSATTLAALINLLRQPTCRLQEVVIPHFKSHFFNGKRNAHLKHDLRQALTQNDSLLKLEILGGGGHLGMQQQLQPTALDMEWQLHIELCARRNRLLQKFQASLEKNHASLSNINRNNQQDHHHHYETLIWALAVLLQKLAACPNPMISTSAIYKILQTILAPQLLSCRK